MFGCMYFGNDAAWKVELDKALPIIKKAIDLGINFFDTANVYSKGRSEEITGQCLKDYREDMVVATKIYHIMGKKPNQSGLSRLHIMQQIKGSLKRLQTDHVDLYQIHRWDYQTPIEETLRPLMISSTKEQHGTLGHQACGHGNSKRRLTLVKT